MLGGDGQQGKAQAVELGHLQVLALLAVHLVDHAERGQAHAPDMRGQMFVQGQKAVAPVHHESHGGGPGQGGLGLGQDVPLKAADAFGAFGHGGVRVQGDAAGIHNAEGGQVLAAHHAFHAVARDAGPVMGDGPVTADQAVEQGGFAHIGATHQDDVGKRVGHGVTLFRRR